MRASPILAAIAVLLPTLTGAAPVPPAAATAVRGDTLLDLRALLDTGVVLQDRNADRVIDFVDVRIVLPDAPTEAETAAAADVAARLGYETSGSDLGLARTVSALDPLDRTPLIVVGERTGLEGRAGLTRADLLRGLGPGQGAVVHLPGLGGGGVALVGYDATGLLVASAYLSGRYPAVWDPDGDPWSSVPEKVATFLDGRGVTHEGTRLRRIVVDGGRPGVVSAEVEVRVGDLPAAVDALLGRDTAPADTDPPSENALRPDTVPPDTAATPDTPAPARSALHVRHLHRLDVRVVGPDSSRTVRVRPESPWNTPAGRAWSASATPFTLSELYEVGGLYRDTNRDLVPDETVARLAVTAGGRARELAPAVATGVADLATRIGLETAGARFPLATVVADDEAPAGLPIRVGTDAYAVRRLLEDDALPGWTAGPGEGTVRLVERGSGVGPSLLVAGGDDPGTAAALEWLAGRAPYLWAHGKGEYRLKDAETEVRRFFQAREAPGQAALALHKLDTWAARLAEGRRMDGDTAAAALERLTVELAVKDAAAGLDAVAETVVRERLPAVDVDVSTFTTGFGVGDTVYHRTFDFGWEVDDVRAALEAEVYPAVRSGQPATVHVRVSEPPEVRRTLETEIRTALEERGASPARATVLSAYKQGYSWIEDVVMPRLEALSAGGRRAASIRISYHTLDESDEIRWQTVAADTRWLQEIYPIDDVLARELDMAKDSITFHATRRADPIYTLTALGPAGDTLLHDAFTPTYVVRPFFDLFPEYERVRVTTGRVTATAAGDTLLDRRVVTDPERFWDALQTDVYGAIVEYVMDIQDGDPSRGNAPYFDRFDVRLRMSEPNRRIGIDEEVISALEALHEDVYFETLTLFDLIGNRYGVGPLSYPGRVLPWIDPTGTGEPGTATVTLTGKERGVPELVVTAERGGGAEPERREYGLDPLPVPAPPLRGVTVRAGSAEEEALRRPGGATASPVSRLLFEVEAIDSLDRFDEYRERSSEAGIDRTFLSVELLRGMLRQLRRLHAAGLYGESVAWDRVAETAFLFRVEDDSTWARVATVPRSPAPLSTDTPELLAEGWTHGGERMVQWERPIPPAENDSVLAKLNTFPGVGVYFMTRSFLGQPIWAADFLPPQPAAYVSQAKLNALKPTLFISGRQHANEVSSTSHILRLGELLATDSTYRAYLDDVNVVLHPITNPDGARLAVEMQETNPDFMLHAGYLGALGVDATSGERDDDPIYPESQVRRRIRETWLPDAYVNMHGYPSHEWVQYFAGYSAWVRSRRGGARDWWAPRGWFIPGFRWVDDEEEPEYTDAQLAMLDSVAASIRALPDVAAMSDRMYARYRKYGKEDREDFREHFRNDVLVYMSLRGAESVGSGVYSPRITYFATTTEAPDETARGDWLELVASAGLAHATALLRYLAEGEYEIERETEAYEDAVVRKVYRVKPVLPSDTESKPDRAGGNER